MAFYLRRTRRCPCATWLTSAPLSLCTNSNTVRIGTARLESEPHDCSRDDEAVHQGSSDTGFALRVAPPYSVANLALY